MEAQVLKQPNERFRDTRWEWVVAPLLISLGVFGLRFVNDPTTWDWLTRGAAATRAPVGLVAREKGGVRYRPLESTLWHDIGEERQTVGTGDTLFTSSDGVAELEVSAGRAQVLPNSLVVIEGGEAGKRGPFALVRSFFRGAGPVPVLGVHEGAVNLALHRRDETLDVRVRDKLYRISADRDGANLELTGESIRSSGEGNLRVAEVHEGETAESVEVRSGEVLVFTETATKVVSVPFELVQPAPGAVVLTSSVQFQWRWHSGARGPARLEIQPLSGISRIFEVSGAQTDAVFELPEGSYRWRMLGDYVSPWRAFQVVSLRAPQLLGPTREHVIRPTGPTTEVAFSWQPVSPELRTELELKGPAGTSITQGRDRGLALSLPEGQYSWRVRVATGIGQASAWSETRRLVIGAPPALQPVPPAPAPTARPARAVPKAEARAPKAVIEILPTLESGDASGSTRIRDASDLNRITVSLRWKPLPKINRYEVTLFRRGEVFQKREVKRPELVLTLTSIEDYSYEVAVTLPNGKRVASARVPIRIVVLPPVLGVPSQGSMVPLSKELLMTWEKTSLTDLYVLEISREASFASTIVREKVKENFFAIVPTSSGQYYWRTKSVSHGRESSYSTVGSFTVK